MMMMEDDEEKDRNKTEEEEEVEEEEAQIVTRPFFLSFLSHPFHHIFTLSLPLACSVALDLASFIIHLS